MPTVVDHSDELPCRGLFLLHQGIQRRIRVTIVHEMANELRWRDVRELVVGKSVIDICKCSLQALKLKLYGLSFSGRIRNTPEPEEEDSDSSVLSLGLFPGEYLEVPGEDRCVFRFEAAWDSSLHNSALLNRVTPYGEHIFLTISAYMEVCQFWVSSQLSYRITVSVLISALILNFLFLHSAGKLWKACNHYKRLEHGYIWTRCKNRTKISEASVHWELS